MGKPKKRTSARRTGSRPSHFVLDLAPGGNAKSPIKVFTTRKESGKALSAEVKSAMTPKPKAQGKPVRPAQGKTVKV